MIMDKLNEIFKNEKIMKDSSGLIICLNKRDFEEVNSINVFWTCKAKMDKYFIWKFDLENIPIIFVASETCPKDKLFIYNI